MGRIVDPRERLLTGLRALGSIGDIAVAEASHLPMHVREVGPHHDVLREGDTSDSCCLIVDGLFTRLTMVAGGRRQILSYHLPGDIPDLQGLHYPKIDFSLSALTPGCVAFIAHSALHNAIERAPDLGSLLWRLTLVDAAMLRARIASIGRRSSYQRMAHLICELFVRMRALGLADENGFALPLTQIDLADALGLSAVHVNRTLQQLRHDGVIVSNGRHLAFTDWPRLKAVADFDDGYLQLQAPSTTPC